mmetsp:Transcript_51479/g.110284  ORF Transcript_51479/g.110284 Transcript_51479/m.110284 type:complete len:649 (+) Transcript_51479:70-2016(+)|eukprot:CAMPEP_0204361458 /NCGR_PEP_ID=MMETSP0469-20131031/38830_1 /ASSEMBLY_ACC=CAM_ASM_000384 /TAXON_ID=2969 /ORGANISM="Oxyrrhis marina" /LENGTH=648 /DNA_ID=CAMNT_0051349853 /DNA_START=91 /DNA_END=2037 /DNA_ORIENTATION=-
MPQVPQKAKMNGTYAVPQEPGGFNESDDEGEDGYVVGGYHRVAIGETYNDRYKTVAKLGWGHFSTVWLCEDLKVKGYAAMKVQKSARHYTEAAYDEIAILSKASQAAPIDGKQTGVVELFDNFEHIGTHVGSNGQAAKHICMVFEVMGPNVLALIKQYNFKGVPMSLVRKVAKDILVGLRHIHAVGIIHTDLKPENVLVACPLNVPVDKKGVPLLNEAPVGAPPDAASSKPSHQVGSDGSSGSDDEDHKHGRSRKRSPRKDGLWEMPPFVRGELKPSRSDPTLISSYGGNAQELMLKLRMPYHHKLEQKEQKSTSKSVKTVKRQDGRCFPKQVDIDRIRAGDVALFSHPDVFYKVADLGNACWVDRHFSDDIQTRQYRSPEVIIGAGYDCSADIWSLGCMLFELATGDYLFDPKASEEYPRDEDHLALTIELMGKLPSYIIKKGTKSKAFFNPRGELRHIKTLNGWGLADVLTQKYKQNAQEAVGFAAFLTEMLSLDPSRRKTAPELLRHAWLRGVEVTATIQQLVQDEAGGVAVVTFALSEDLGVLTTQVATSATVAEVRKQVAAENRFFKVHVTGPNGQPMADAAPFVPLCVDLGVPAVLPQSVATGSNPVLDPADYGQPEEAPKFVPYAQDCIAPDGTAGPGAGS